MRPNLSNLKIGQTVVAYSYKSLIKRLKKEGIKGGEKLEKLEKELEGIKKEIKEAVAEEKAATKTADKAKAKTQKAYSKESKIEKKLKDLAFQFEGKLTDKALMGK